VALVLLGLNHRSAPVAMRERLAIAPAELAPLLRSLSRQPGVRECYILSTCNRVEILACTPDGAPAESLPLEIFLAERFLAERFRVEPTELRRHLYSLRERDAVLHLFRVASGLDSMILGETQVLGQAKDAYMAARAAGTLGPVLETLLQRAFAAAKRVRTETGISRSTLSVANAAVELAEQIFGELTGRSVLLLGVGKMSQHAARHLASRGVSPVIVATRTLGHAVALAEKIGGVALPFDSVHETLAQVDILIASTAAPHAVIRREHAERAIRARRNRPLFIIDIAVPRDVEPEVNEIDNVYLYNIDDLEAVVEANRTGRQREARAAEAILQKECEAYFRRKSGASLGQTIGAILRRAEEMRSAEVQRLRRRLGPLTPGQEEQIEALTKSLMNKLLHRPIQEIKRAAQERGEPEAVEAARRYFELSGTFEPSATAAEAEENGERLAGTDENGELPAPLQADEEAERRR